MRLNETSPRKPGAAFAFRPHNTLHLTREPDFFKSPPKVKHVVFRALNPDQELDLDRSDIPRSVALRPVTSIMVNERAPPKAPLQPAKPADANTRRERSPDDDDDIISAISSQTWATFKPEAAAKPDAARDPFRPSSSSTSNAFGHPRVGGHPAKMMSSRKQQANVFVQQKTRPEHHLDATKVRAPTAPKLQDRKPPPLPTFDSNFFTSNDTFKSNTTSSQPKSYSEEVFYTDPGKASADLKDLLEGNIDEDDEDDKDGTKDKTSGEAGEKTKNDSKSGVVPGLSVKLLPHQVEGVEWMRGRELGPVKRGKVPKGGILADDMGLGKTLQTLALILTNQRPAKEDKGWKKHFEGLEKTTLVVAPLSLIRQWESEIVDKISKSHRLKVYVHHGPNRTKSYKELALYDVVVTTYQILVSEHGHSSMADGGVKAGCFGLRWWRVVLDEAHTIKNRNAKATKACYALRSEYRWCLSGTPMQNNLDELQSLIKFLQIKPYDDLKEWKAHIDLPLKNGKGHIALRRLHSLLRCFMKRRTKEILKEAGALNPGGKPSEDGEASSNGFKVTQRNVVTVTSELSPAERRFYNRLQARADRSMEAMMGGKVSYASALTLLLRMRQACNHPKLVAGKVDKDALSTGIQQKSQEVDIDDMADMFAGISIASRNCSICGLELTDNDSKMKRNSCSDCSDDLDYFDNKQPSQVKERTKKKKMAKTQQPSSSSNSKTKRRPRNRQAVIDSDDEDEADGSWLVPEAERSRLKLGKAGGEEDENAEGGGDWIGAEDSEEDDAEDDKNKSNLSSFIVDDEAARAEKGYISANGESQDSDSDDSFLSISAITQKMASQTLEDKPVAAKGSRSERRSKAGQTDDESSYASQRNDESESGSEEDDYDSDDNDFDTRRRAKEMSTVASAKVRELIKILRKEVHEHKFIVFSQFTSMLDIVEPFLEEEEFEYTRYDGSMKNDAREESLNRLRKDKNTRILLCSLKCGSLGLNLTAATRVVIIEPFWNPFIEEQAIDRVHRLTQTVDVTVYKLTVQDTVEERILDLQEKKRLLAEQAIEGGMKKGALKLGLNEIIDLFKPTSHFEDAPEQVGGIGDTQQAMRDLAAVARKRKPAGPKRQESELYGRRW